MVFYPQNLSNIQQNEGILYMMLYIGGTEIRKYHKKVYVEFQKAVGTLMWVLNSRICVFFRIINS